MLFIQFRLGAGGEKEVHSEGQKMGGKNGSKYKGVVFN